ncbi:conserved repeat domain-containing protein [Asanoa hainanensis]|uniref:Conserved repeat domain-containing protein n=1 Tax=Asanoa hainanensis TaxID=560556 RepID=A0A239JVI2_9ACTN|nr:DUF11 domain-containing protein [Asanoa hainanensis]SNT09871.1 conserved repeat domain-containing protein [Asanoa hainanensis]
MKGFRLAGAAGVLPLGLLLVLPGLAVATPTPTPNATPSPTASPAVLRKLPPPRPIPTTVDVAVTGKVAPVVVRPGQDATLTFTARNEGVLPAGDVRVAVPLPAQVTVTRPVASQGTFDGLLWSIGSLPVRKAATLTLLVRGSTPATVTATAALVGSTPRDGDAHDDLATAALRVAAPAGTRVPRADLVLSARVAPELAGPGDPVTYAVTIANKGPDAAPAVEVADPVLTGTFLASSASAGQVVGMPVRTGGPASAARWRVGTLAPGASATWAVRTLATVAPVGDAAVLVTQSGADDPVGGDTVARAAPKVTAADLALTRDVSNRTPSFGQEITVTVTASNAGPDLARGVVVSDPFGAELEFVSASMDAGDYDDGRWTVGDLAVGAVATLTLRARVAVAGRISGRATVEGEPDDPDSANNAVETVLEAGSGAAPHLPAFRTGFPLPYTEIRFSTMEAAVVGGLMMMLGLVLLLHLRRA